MKYLILFLALISLNLLATDIRVIDTKGLLNTLNSKLASKSLEDFNKDDSVKVLSMGALKDLKVKRANQRRVILKGEKRIKISDKEFKAAKHNMMYIILKDSNVKVTINGQVYENTYLVNSVSNTTHILDDGTQIPAFLVKISSPDVELSTIGLGPAVQMSFVISDQTPAIAQILKIQMNDLEIFDIREINTK
jgi:hypothetical protein